MNCQVCQQPRGGLIPTGNWFSCGVCRATQDLVSTINTCRIHPSRESFLITQIRNLTGEVRESCWPLPQTQPLILVKGGFISPGLGASLSPPPTQNVDAQTAFTNSVGTASKAAGPKPEVKEELHTHISPVDCSHSKPDEAVPAQASSNSHLRNIETTESHSDDSGSRSSCSRGELEQSKAHRLGGKRGKKNKGRKREAWFKDKLGDKGHHRIEGDQSGPRWRREGARPPPALPKKQSQPPGRDRRHPHDPANGPR